jgi:hypothetical protein
MKDKISELLSELNIEDLLASIDESSFGSSYIKSYPAFIDFFKRNSNLDELSLIQGAFMIYGWMPRILNISKHNLESDKILVAIDELGHEVNLENLKIVTEFMNNSLVGASKLLHFKFPNKYPIWDSKTCHVLLGNSTNSKIQKIENYIKYQKSIETFVGSDFCIQFKRKFKNKFNYEISDTRAIEYVIFNTQY